MIERSSYHARVEENGNGVTHQIITWRPDAVLYFLGQYHVPNTKLILTLYPVGVSPVLVSGDEQAYTILKAGVALNEKKDAETCVL